MTSTEGKQKYCWGRPGHIQDGASWKTGYEPDLGCYSAIAANFERAVVLFDAYEWDSSNFRHANATQAIVANTPDHLWSKLTLNMWKPRFQPFTGNKTMKPLYLMFQPEYKGANISIKSEYTK